MKPKHFAVLTVLLLLLSGFSMVTLSDEVKTMKDAAILHGVTKDARGLELHVGDKVKLKPTAKYGKLSFCGNPDCLTHKERYTIEKINEEDKTLVFKEIPDIYGPFLATDFVKPRSPGRPKPPGKLTFPDRPREVFY